jgi:acetoin utilization deacetylase AcuC-like enzyme
MSANAPLIYSTDHFVLPLPPAHRFPMRKYALLRQRVAAIAAPLMREPAPVTDADLARAHDPAYIEAVVTGTLDSRALQRIGFPWTPAMVERSRRSSGATLAACRSALASGCGINLAGGTHHAHRDFGAGYCVFNDSVVALRALQAEGAIGRALIVDLDVHQGDGTAALLAGDPSLFTMSLHGRGNFPFRKQSSRLDVELADGTGDAAYLATLAIALPRAFDAARPDLVIYLAGADPFEGDRFGRLALTKRGLAERDRYVLETLRRCRVPVAITMAGGYAHDDEDVVDIHFATVALALDLFAPAAHVGTHALAC